MPPFTKLASVIFAAVDGYGAPRSVVNDDVQVWGTEIEAAINALIDLLAVMKLTPFTVATAPSASEAGEGAMIYVTDEAGGAIPAFSDGTDWRRMSDRSVIS